MSVLQYLRNIKNRFKENTLDSLIWLVYLGEILTGLNIFLGNDIVSVLTRRTIHAIQAGHMFYMYVVGGVAYFLQYATNLVATLQSIVYLVAFIIHCNSLIWIVVTRLSVKEVLEINKKCDALALENEELIEKHKDLLSTVKLIILIFYSGIILETVAYLIMHLTTTALTDPNEFSIVVCMGMGQLDKNPNRGLCSFLMVCQIWGMAIILIYYTNVFFLLVGHLTVMYELLAAEMVDIPEKFKTITTNYGILNENTGIVVLDQNLVKNHLRKLAYRHSLVLEAITRVQKLYSIPMGVDFGSSLVIAFMVIILPLKDIFKFNAFIAFGTLHFLMYCMMCQRLENASTKYEMAVYCCGWEDFDMKNRKSVLIMLVQAQRRISILAAGVAPLKMTTFSTGMETLYKFGAAFKV